VKSDVMEIAVVVCSQSLNLMMANRLNIVIGVEVLQLEIVEMTFLCINNINLVYVIGL
jgi:hypothetical protein